MANGFAVTALTRDTSKTSFSSGVQVTEVDYESVDSLVSAFRGHDVVISALGPAMLGAQTRLIDRRWCPTVATMRVRLRHHQSQSKSTSVLRSKASGRGVSASSGKRSAITYTNIMTGPFLDWCIMVGLILNAKQRSIELYDGGDRPFSITTLKSIGKAVAAALKKPEESKNKIYYV